MGGVCLVKSRGTTLQAEGPAPSPHGCSTSEMEKVVAMETPGQWHQVPPPKSHLPLLCLNFTPRKALRDHAVHNTNGENESHKGLF